MIPIEELFQDGQFSAFINEKSTNAWKGTLFEKYYEISNHNKGILGEKIAAKHMRNLNHDVRPRVVAGQDFMIDGYKTEVKLSLAQKAIQNRFALNHISMKKDWERLIFLGINYDYSKSKMVFFTREDFIDYMETEDSPLFRHQQGGEKIKNDDYFFMGNFNKFFLLDFVYDISEWRDKKEKRDGTIKKGLELWFS